MPNRDSQDSINALKARIAQLEQALDAQHAERSRRLHYALQASRDGLWDWDIASGKLYFSQSYLRLLGYDYGALPGTFDTLCDYFLHPEDAEAVKLELRTAIDNRREHLTLEHRMLHRDGHTLWVHTQGLLVEPDADGRATRMVGTLTDITPMVESREQLVTAKAQAEMASHAKSRFLASMSHEIRTPMNAIIGLGHLLSETQLDDEQRSYVTGMHAAAESLLQVINQVFDYTKLEASNIILDNSHFDLEQVFERLSRMFEANALHRPVNIIFDIEESVPRFLRGDATRLGHVISHLVTNALQYSHSEEVLVKAAHVTANKTGVTLRFSITDFGTGLEPRQLQQLRQSLSHMPYQGRDTTEGFGLQICKLLVRLMNGTLNFTSEPGVSTTLSFTADFEKSQIGTNAIHSISRACKAIRLLVVDDNQLARDILAKSASKLVGHIDTAGDAHRALQKIRDAQARGAPYDLVLLDYKMPLKSGLEAARDIKTASDIDHKPIIFLVSSFHRDEIFLDYRDSDYVDDFLSKPVSESRLFDAICRSFPETLLPQRATDQHRFSRLRGRRILLVEDNPVNQTVAAGILRKQGVEVISVDNGQQAIDALAAASDKFDLVLMDVEMPVMNGLEATRELRLLPDCEHLPVIALTAQAMPDDRQQCLAAGMNDYISKPIQPETLYQLLCDWLDNCETQDNNST